MRIVHYTLGIYPMRTGGLNRYATDLTREQAKENSVAVLMPGGWRPWCRVCNIRYRGEVDGLKCYHLRNAEPLPLLYGIRHPKNFAGYPINKESFENFYNDFKPGVLHLHTLMGLPEEALRFFKEKGVRIVYTSHDYFGICPKVNLINQQGELCVGPTPERCAACNMQAPSTLFLKLRNSGMAFKTRDIVRWLKNTLRF